METIIESSKINTQILIQVRKQQRKPNLDFFSEYTLPKPLGGSLDQFIIQILVSYFFTSEKSY